MLSNKFNNKKRFYPDGDNYITVINFGSYSELFASYKTKTIYQSITLGITSYKELVNCIKSFMYFVASKYEMKECSDHIYIVCFNCLNF